MHKLGSSTRKWMIIAVTGGDVSETYARSEPAAYREVRQIAVGVANSTSRVTTVHVKKWQDGKWGLFETLSRDELIAMAPAEES